MAKQKLKDEDVIKWNAEGTEPRSRKDIMLKFKVGSSTAHWAFFRIAGQARAGIQIS